MRGRFDSNFRDLERKDELGPFLREMKDYIEMGIKEVDLNDAQEEVSMQENRQRPFPGEKRRIRGYEEDLQQSSRAREDRFGSSPSAAINKQ